MNLRTAKLDIENLKKYDGVIKEIDKKFMKKFKENS